MRFCRTYPSFQNLLFVKEFHDFIFCVENKIKNNNCLFFQAQAWTINLGGVAISIKMFIPRKFQTPRKKFFRLTPKTSKYYRRLIVKQFNCQIKTEFFKNVRTCPKKLQI